ncbi:MAG: protein-disulfide reductase DsbD domain-containing protein [Sneathiella sp.]
MKQFYRISILYRLFIALSAYALAVSFVVAEPSEWKRTEFSQARLISATTGVGGAREILLGFHVKLSPGWKTYWRSPGDSGIPPQFNWSGSENLEKVEIFWPKPMAFDSYGLLAWGYKDEVVYLLNATLEDPEQPLQIALEMFYGICEEVCIPVKQDFQLTVPTGAQGVSPEAGLLEAYLKRIPAPIGDKAAVTSLIFKNKLENLLKIEAFSTVDFKDPHLILEGQEGDYFTVKETRIFDGKRKVVFLVEADLVDKSTQLKGQDFTATLLDATIAVEGRATVK